MSVRVVSSAAPRGVWCRIASRADRKGYVFCSALVALFVFASLAHADPPAGSTPSFPASQVSVSIAGDTKTRSEVLYINRDQCEVQNEGKGAAIAITVASLSTQVNAGARVLELWVGQTGSQDCEDGSNRQTLYVSDGERDTVCHQVGEAIYSFDSSEQSFELNARMLFSSAPDDSDVGCDLLNGRSLWIVPLVNETPTSGAPDDGLAPALEIKFVVDVTPLDAPAEVTGGSGETQARLSWDAPNGASSLTTYEVYVDLTAIGQSGEGVCSSELLNAGEEMDSAVEADLDCQQAGRGTSLVVDPRSLGLAFGEQVPAAVVAVDEAGNRSVLSQSVCIRMVDTQGFWDACDAAADCRDGFSGCAVSSAASHAGSAGWAVALIGAASWLRRGRRRRAASGRRCSAATPDTR